MRERIINTLNRPSTLFLSYPKGKIYFIDLIIVFAIFLNVFQPFDINNWQALHKHLFLSGYSVVYIGTYGVIYFVYSWFRPAYFRRESWTIGKDLHILSIYVPITAIHSWFFTDYYIEEVSFSISLFLSFQLHNSILGVFTLACFGYFIYTQLRPAKLISPATLPPSEDILTDNTPVPVTEEPTTVVEELTEVAISEPPTEVAATEEIIPIAVTEESTEVAITESPTEVAATEELIPIAVAEEPSTVVITEESTEVASPAPTGFIIIKGEKVNVSSILYVESSVNTIFIHVLQGNRINTLSKIMTLTAFRELVADYPYIKHCQGSYLININQVEHWSEASSKMTFSLYKQTIPVSKSKKPYFKKLMKEMGIDERFVSK